MMYSNIRRIPRRNASRFSIAGRIVVAIFLSAFLLISLLLCLLALPSWQVRLTGVETKALARATSNCSDDDDSADSFVFTYSFTGPQGKQYQIAQDDFCTNVINDGDYVTIWYMPNDPTRLLTTPQVILLYVFSALGAVADLVCLLVILLAATRHFSARRGREMFDNPAVSLRQWSDR